MHLLALPRLLFAFLALILSLLCLFAGSKRGFIEDADIVTLNVSMLCEVATLRVLPKHIGLHDFYSWHVLGYCEGYYIHSKDGKALSAPIKNVTYCSKPTSFFHFDPIAVLDTEVKKGFTLGSLQWLEPIELAFEDAKLATVLMFLFYCVGTVTAGLGVLGGLAGLRWENKFTAKVCTALTTLGFFTLVFGFAVVLYANKKINHAVNRNNAPRHACWKLFGITLAAALLMLCAAIAWFRLLYRLPHNGVSRRSDDTVEACR